ncbi:MAG: phosphonate C-P lyase system protein PhnH [Bilophila wadsworthia]
MAPFPLRLSDRRRGGQGGLRAGGGRFRTAALSAFAQGVPATPTVPQPSSCRSGFDAGTRFRGSAPHLRKAFTCTLPEDFAERWRENTSGFPLGVDMLLCGADGVAGLPRTTRLERLPQESASCM